MARQRLSNSTAAHRKKEVRRQWSLICPLRSSARSQRFSLQALAREGSFAEIVAKLQNDSVAERKEWLHASSALMGESALHVLLQNQPPLNVVIAVIQAMRDLNPGCVPEAMCDAIGRTPLHVACAFACSVVVVARLLNGASEQFRKPAAVQDAAFMIPLHWACQAAATVSNKKELENLVQVVSFLVDIFPKGVELQNSAGLTPSGLLASQALAPKVQESLNGALQRNSGRVDSADDDSLSLPQKSWIPSEICLDDTLDVSTLGRRGVAAPHKNRVVETTEESDGSLSEITSREVPNCPYTGTVFRLQGVVTDGVVCLDGANAPLAMAFDNDVPPKAILEDIKSFAEEADDFAESSWCPFEEFNVLARKTLTRQMFAATMSCDEWKLQTDNSVKTTVTATQVSSSSNLDLDEIMDAMGAPSGDADELFA
jgi:hypothetical protein